MKSNIFRLESVGVNTVGGPEAGALELIYNVLLEEFGQKYYSCIFVNHITKDLNELIVKEPNNKIFINIQYPIYSDFETKSIDEKNRIRLEVVHTALLKIAEYDKKLEVDKLEDIKNKILSSNFIFSYDIKEYPVNKKLNLTAKVVVHPQIDRFDYYTVISENGKEKCRLLIYSAGTNLFYFSYFFKTARWEKDNILILSGTRNELETHIFLKDCRIELKNLTQYVNPPFYTAIKFGVSEKDKQQARKDLDHALPPHISGIIREDIQN